MYDELSTNTTMHPLITILNGFGNFLKRANINNKKGEWHGNRQ